MNSETLNENSSLQIGETLPYFCIPGTDGKLYSSTSFLNDSCLVFIFTSNHCPYAQGYKDRIIALENEVKKLSVQFIAICSNDGQAFPEDSFEKMKEISYNFPYLHDKNQIVAKSFGAELTPEIFVFDKSRQLQYHGAFDDSPRDADLVKNPYLRDAVYSILEGDEVLVKETHFIGCSIKWSLN